MRTQLKIILSSSILMAATWGAVSFAHSKHYTKQARNAENSYSFRTANMAIFKWYLSPMGAMVKGKIAFNKDVFAKYARGLETISKLELLEGFPQESGEDHVDDSDAKEEIWSNWKDFTAKNQSFKKEAAKLARIATTGDESDIKIQFKRTAGTCSACHKEYKAK